MLLSIIDYIFIKILKYERIIPEKYKINTMEYLDSWQEVLS